MRTQNTIHILVKLYGSLVEFKPVESESPEFAMETVAEMTIEQLIARLNIPVENVKMSSLNDKLVKKDQKLSNGDRLVLFSTIAGG